MCSNAFNPNIKFSARTIDFGGDTPLNMVSVPKGSTVTARYDLLNEGLQYTNNYGFLGGFLSPDLTQWKNLSICFDAMNEAGLGVCSLEFNDSIGQYQTPKSTNNENIDIFYVVAYLAGMCDSVGACRNLLASTNVTGAISSDIFIKLGSHIMVQDSSGACGIFEWFNGEVTFTDLAAIDVNVATNSPAINYQLKNLHMYSGVTNVNSNPKDNNIAPLGNGSGTTQIPADATPPSRFVRLYFNNQFADTSKTDFNSRFSIMANIIGKVNVVLGEVVEASVIKEWTGADYSQITFIRCHDPKLGYGYWAKSQFNDAWVGVQMTTGNNPFNANYNFDIKSVNNPVFTPATLA
ncbi:MAG: linear amide C-N hydrolase [Methylobacter sp.]